MNFLKPTKVKALGTIAVYVAGTLAGWISGGLVLLFFPKGTVSNLQQEVVDIKEGLDIPIANIFGASFAGFVIRVILIYLAVCFIVYILENQKRVDNRGRPSK